MSTVRKAIYVNPIEPAPLSFRCGARVDTTLEVTYYQQSDIAYPIDLDGQMRLTSRSGNVSKVYSMPASDIANGKARAFIPAGDVVDPNGYWLTLYATVNSEILLVAKGLVVPNDYEAPLEEAIDVIDTVPITFATAIAVDTVFTVKLWDDASKSDPYDLAGKTISAPILTGKGGTKLVDMTVTPVGPNVVTLSLQPAAIATLPASCWWTLTIGGTGGTTTLCEGPVTVT
jgi:hypothetical protein